MQPTLNSYFVVALVVLTLSGCAGSTPSRFYALTPVKSVTGMAPNHIASGSFAIGIRTLKLPEYLLRQQIVRRKASKVILAEFDRWAEPLEANFKRVLVEDLSNDIPTNNIFLFPAHDSALVNFQLLLEVTEFEFSEGHVTLSARWGLDSGENVAFLLKNRSSFSEQITSDTFDEIVAAMSRLIGKLSQEIATEIRAQTLSVK